MKEVKQVTVDVQGNDTVVCLMAGAVYDLVDLLEDKTNEMELAVLSEKPDWGDSEWAEFAAELQHWREIKVRLSNYL